MSEDIARSKFELSDSTVAGSGDGVIPEPGTIIHQFRLLDFVPKEMLKLGPDK